MASFERNYEQIANTELWHLLQRSEEQGLGRDFVAAVGTVCAIGLDLSKDIIRFFPRFTCHDGDHSAHVCDWLVRLLGEHIKNLTVHETALLLMAACCHDIGMCVSDEQKRKLVNPEFSGWKDYFASHLDDDEEFCCTGRISDRMLRNYVRLHHHERIRENLRKSDWPRELSLTGLPWEALLTLCKSHGTSLSRSELKNTANYDLLLCAVLLRLADLLDYDASRTSDALFRHMGLDIPQTEEEVQSAHEHCKNRVGAFSPDIRDGVIRYRAVYDHPQMEHDIREYLDWIERELDHCAEILTQADKRWQDLPLPYKISTDDAERNGYAAGKFCMTMDQDRVIELLTGKNLYSDPGVFVRELLQNSIDAVLMRAKQDTDFSLEEGRIIIDTWPDDAGNTWFRIRDNGTGMDEHIIQNYFLKVGRSYYTSDEFRAANRHAPGGKSYTAISRFGIGILSCFMTDPEGTELKVSTKRFRGNGGNGIRLDVTGLHGYYYLSHEAQHPDYEDSFLQMPSPDGEDRGYREEPGTTICVRTNLFRMGGVQSFREILDGYVQFPEIRVEYNGPEGHKEYPTQQELMDAVHALNPDGVVKEYVHELPNNLAKQFKEHFSIIEWKENPAVVLRYYPLDRVSDSENMTGVSVNVTLRYPSEIRQDWLSLTKDERIELVHYVDTVDGLSIVVSLNNLWDLRRSNPTIEAMEKSLIINLPIEESSSFLTPQEKKVIVPLLESLRTVLGNGLTSYHGVTTTRESPFNSAYSVGRNVTVLLLRGNFLPKVNVARDQISGIPLEATCCYTMAAREVDLSDALPSLGMESERLLTQRELWEVLERHPSWIEALKGKLENRAKVNILRYDAYSDEELIDQLCLCVAKHTNKVFYNFSKLQPNRDQIHFIVSSNIGDKLTQDFPVVMFAYPLFKETRLAQSNHFGDYIYNQNHPYSIWLIEKRAKLVKKVPAMYDTLIRMMMLCRNSCKICETVNTILTRLRGYNGNYFGIHDGLFLTEADFV